jgi:hypothetical protein
MCRESQASLFLSFIQKKSELGGVERIHHPSTRHPSDGKFYSYIKSFLSGLHTPHVLRHSSFKMSHSQPLAGDFSRENLTFLNDRIFVVCMTASNRGEKIEASSWLLFDLRGSPVAARDFCPLSSRVVKCQQGPSAYTTWPSLHFLITLKLRVDTASRGV